MGLVWDPVNIKKGAWDAPEGAQGLQMGLGSKNNDIPYVSYVQKTLIFIRFLKG